MKVKVFCEVALVGEVLGAGLALKVVLMLGFVVMMEREQRCHRHEYRQQYCSQYVLHRPFHLQNSAAKLYNKSHFCNTK